MSLLTYNDIPIELVETESVEKTPVFDGPAYLWTIYRITVNGAYNPLATSAERTGSDNTGGNEDVSVVNGKLPYETDAAIRDKLMQPRKVLLFEDSESNEIIRSPRTGRDVDVNNGPKPVNCNVFKIMGSSTWQIKFTVETYIRESELYSTKGESPLVSHTWKMSEAINELHRTVRVIEGRVHFNADWLDENDRLPDDFRKHLIPPPQARFHRDSLEFTVDESSNALQYRVVDASRKWHYKQFGIVDVQIFEQMGQKTRSLTDSLVDMAISGVPAGIQAFGSGRATGAIIATAGSTVGAIRASMPTRFVYYKVRVAGDLNQSIATISTTAHRILRYRIARTRAAGGNVLGRTVTDPILQNIVDTRANNFIQDIKELQIIHENIVEVEATFISGVIDSAFVNNDTNVLDGAYRLLRSNDDNAGDVADVNRSAPRRGASYPDADNGTRQSVRQNRLEIIAGSLAQDAAFSQEGIDLTVRRVRNTTNPQA